MDLSEAEEIGRVSSNGKQHSDNWKSHVGSGVPGKCLKAK